MFKIINRGKKDYIVLIPGWAFDCRIFDGLDLEYNYVYFSGKSNCDFEGVLKNFISKNGIKKISLFGWSQGSFLAYNFAWMNPGIVDELILVSMKKKYDRNVIENIKKYLKKNKDLYLYKFYEQCFSKEEREHFVWFKNNLLNDYLNIMKLEDLVEGLDLLACAEIKPDVLKKIGKIKIIHGEEDKIAPVNEILDMKNILPDGEFLFLKNTGHLAFLKGNMSGIKC